MSEQPLNNANQIKQMLINNLIQQYSGMVKLIKDLPMNQAFLSNGLMNWDQGFMWFEKGILSMNLDTPTQPDAVAEVPKQEVNVTKIETETDGA